MYTPEKNGCACEILFAFQIRVQSKRAEDTRPLMFEYK